MNIHSSFICKSKTENPDVLQQVNVLINGCIFISQIVQSKKKEQIIDIRNNLNESSGNYAEQQQKSNPKMLHTV